jgi:uncharacterized protein YdhG (YjbR/CyaY superfamily)
MAARFESVDEYIGTFPEDVQVILESIRQTIHRAVPGATESISYNMPTFSINGRYFLGLAGWKNHIALYPRPSGDE